MYRPAPADGRLFAALLGSIILLAWAALLAWDFSPYAGYLDHRELANVEISPGSEALLFAGAFVSGWALMILAMMLPTSLPLMQMFYRMTGRRENRKTLLALVIAGYLGVWLGFGVLVHSADWILHQVVAEKVAIIDERPWIIAAPTLVLAGVYQFTPLKYHCLDKCRSPLAFISEHWHGQDASRESVQLGINHGVFCIGCCWSLMVVMFAVGLGNLGWMLLLGVIMALEKNASWGWRLSRPLGAGLIFAGLLTLLIPGPATCAC